MRIKRIRIESFGKLTNWESGDLGDGVTVFYGDNEAGKTTITEFIRDTLFPTGKRNKYPARDRKTDSGTIVVEMDDGERRVYERNGNKTIEQNGKPMPGEEFSLDADDYSSLYAMDLERLNEAKLISEGKYRKYLTVPGAANIPAISDEIQKEMKELLNEDRISRTKGIGKSIEEIRKAENSIAEAKAHDDEYDELFSERAELNAKADELRHKDEQSREEDKRRGIIESQAGNLKKLDALKEEIDTLSLVEVSDADVEKYQSLKNKVKSAKDMLATAEGKAPPTELEGRSPEDVLALAGDIEASWKSTSTVEILEKQLADVERKIKDEEQTIAKNIFATGLTEDAVRSVDFGDEVISRAEREGDGKQSRNSSTAAIAFILGAILLAIGAVAFVTPVSFFMGIAFSIFGIIAFLFGIYLYITSSANNDWNSWIVSKGYPEGTAPREVLLIAPKLRDIAECNVRCASLKTEADKISSDIAVTKELYRRPADALGMGDMPYVEAVEKMYLYLSVARMHSAEINFPHLKNEVRKASEELDKFLAERGGAEKFSKSLLDTKRLGEARKDAVALESSIESSSGISVAELRKLISEVVDEPVQKTETSELEAVNKSIGELNIKLEAILDEQKLDDARVRKATAEAKLLTEIKRWATLSLAEHLITSAASHFYEDHQPDVVKRANVYLGKMTGDRYSLYDDPREKDLHIWDGYTKKSPSQWSSGLGDQVYLSVKLAIAASMGRESMPMVLDDVLVRFDDKRKQGAAKAIVECAKDCQIIVLTCNKDLHPLFEKVGNPTLIELS